MSASLRSRTAPNLLPLGLVAAAALAIPWMTSGKVALPPPLWLAALVAVTLIVAVHRPGPPRYWPDLAFAALIGLASASAHLERGLVLGHDTIHHVWAAWAYLQAWHAGDLLPLWLHHLGLGMPLPIAYGPLPFWAMSPIALLGGGPAAMLAGSFVLAGVVAAFSAWRAVAVWTHDRRAALVAAAAWAFAPYRLADANYRAALGESWALAVVPLVLVGFDRLLVAPSRRRFVAATLSISLVAVAHPLSLVMMAVALLVLFAARVPLLAPAGAAALARSAGRGASAAACGLALVGFFALPLLVGMRSLNITSLRDPVPKYGAHGLDAEQLVERRLWSDLEWSMAADDSGPGRAEMPFYVGLVLFAGLAAATTAAFGSRRDPESAWTPLAAVGVVALMLSLLPLARLFSAVEPIALLQFPWRFLGPASAAAALAVGCLAARPASFRRPATARSGWMVAAFLALAVAGDGFAYSGAVARAEPWHGVGMPVESIFASGVVHVEGLPEPWPLRYFGIFLPPAECCAEVNEVYSEFPEYFTPLARRTSTSFARSSIGVVMHGDGQLETIDALPYARLWPEDAQAPRGLEFQRERGRIEVAVPARARGRVEVAEQYFPGWLVDRGSGWETALASEQGLLSADVTPGTHRVRFRFDRWRWDMMAGRLIALLTALGLAFALRGARRPAPAVES